MRSSTLAKLEPMVAKPHSPDNGPGPRSLRHVKIDRAYIGSCTGGKTDRLHRRRQDPQPARRSRSTTFIVPGHHAKSTRTWTRRQARRQEPATKSSPAAGCKIGPASCAACLGGPEDTFGRANEPIT